MSEIMGHRVRRSASFLSFFFFVLWCPSAIFAQTTQVTGQVTDSNGIPYAGASMKAGLVFAGTPVSNPIVTINSLSQCKANGFGSAPCQVPFAPTNGPFNLDSQGNIPGGGITLQDNTQVTPSGTQWAFTVNTPGNAPPLGTGPQTCTATLTISGASQSISSSFSSCPALGHATGGGALPGGGSVGQTVVNTGPGAGSWQNYAFSNLSGTATKGQLPASTVFIDQANIFGAFLNDFSSSTLKIPNGAGLGPTASGGFALDTTNGRLTFGFGGSNFLVPWFVSATPVNTQCVTWSGTLGALGSISCPPGLTASNNSVNQVAIFTSATNLTGVGTGLTKQLFMANNNAAPTFNSPGVAGRTVSGTSDTILCDSATTTQDRVSTVQYTAATAVAVTLPQAGSSGCGANFTFAIWVTGAGSVTVTPTTSTINGQTTLVLPTNTWTTISSPDNVNYIARSANFIKNGTNISVTINADGSITFNVPISWATPSAGTATSTAIFPGGDLFNGGINAQAGTSYTVAASDENKLLTFNNAAAVAVTLPQATTAGFTVGAFFTVFNRGAGAVTVTPTTSTINGGSSIVLNQSQGALIVSDGTNYSAWISSAPSGSGTVTSVAAQNGVETTSGSPITGTGTVQGNNIPNNQTGTSYTVVTGDRAKLLTFSNASAIAVTLPQAGASFPNGWFAFFENRGAGTVTITPTTSTIDGAASFTLTTNQGISISSDGTNYFTGNRGVPSSSGISNASANQLAHYTSVNTLGGIDLPDYHYFPAAACVNGSASSGWSTGATPAATCRAGTNNLQAFLGGGAGGWSATDTAQMSIGLPADWDSATNPSVRLRLASTDATNGHTVIMQLATACSKGDGSTTDDVAFNTAQSFSTITLNGNANRQWDATLSNITMTGCVPDGILNLKLSRTTDTATNVEVYGLGITIPRLPLVQAN